MPWIAARLSPNREALALDMLKRGGFPTYAPRIAERRTLRGRRVASTPLLFPSYVFVEIALQWHAVRWTVGIASLVMTNGTPAKVDDEIIATLRQREDKRGLIALPEPPRIKLGDRVRVTRGPLAGLAGLCVEQTAHERVAILLHVLGGARRVTVPAASVEAVR